MEKHLVKKDSLEASSELESNEDDTPSQEISNYSDIPGQLEKEDLYRSKENLRLFMKQLGAHCNNKIQPSVAEYYTELIHKYLTPEYINKFADKRVEK